jgi:predicted RNase H-like HicB family nuclease
MEFEVDFELEEDGRWIAAVERLPGVMAYGITREEAQAKAVTLAKVVVQEQVMNVAAKQGLVREL